MEANQRELTVIEPPARGDVGLAKAERIRDDLESLDLHPDSKRPIDSKME